MNMLKSFFSSFRQNLSRQLATIVCVWFLGWHHRTTCHVTPIGTSSKHTYLHNNRWACDEYNAEGLTYRYRIIAVDTKLHVGHGIERRIPGEVCQALFGALIGDYLLLPWTLSLIPVRTLPSLSASCLYPFSIQRAQPARRKISSSIITVQQFEKLTMNPLLLNKLSSK